MSIGRILIPWFLPFLFFFIDRKRADHGVRWHLRELLRWGSPNAVLYCERAWQDRGQGGNFEDRCDYRRGYHHAYIQQCCFASVQLHSECLRFDIREEYGDYAGCQWMHEKCWIGRIRRWRGFRGFRRIRIWWRIWWICINWNEAIDGPEKARLNYVSIDKIIVCVVQKTLVESKKRYPSSEFKQYRK